MASGRCFKVLAALLVCGSLTAAPLKEVPRIVIDPGHGGKDPGAVVRRGMREKEVAISLSRKIALSLEKKLGAQVVLTRSKDRFLSLEERDRIANRNRCDLFLSIHANSSRNRKASGIEIYYLNRASDEAARRLAERENEGSPQRREDVEAILSDLIQTAATEEAAELAGILKKTLSTRLKKDGVKEVRVKSALFYVLVGAKCPSLLVETGFLTNSRDISRLKNKQHQSRFAEAVAESVRLYLTARRNQDL